MIFFVVYIVKGSLQRRQQYIDVCKKVSTNQLIKEVENSLFCSVRALFQHELRTTNATTKNWKISKTDEILTSLFLFL